MNAKEYQSALTLAARNKRKLDEMARDLIAKTQALDPNQALMVMTLIGHRLLEAQSIRQSRGLAKYADLKSERVNANAKNLQLARGLEPEEVRFGENVMVVSDLLKQVRSTNKVGREGNSPEENYAKVLMEYSQQINELHAYEQENGLELTSFAMKAPVKKTGRPANIPVERIEKDFGDGFSVIKLDFKRRKSVPGKMGRPGKDLIDWWTDNAQKVVGPRQMVLDMDAKIAGDSDVIARAISLNKKIIQVAKAMISNKPVKLPDTVIKNIEYHVAQAGRSNQALDLLQKKLGQGSELSGAESMQAVGLMKAASEQRYQFYVDDVKARFPEPFKNPKIEEILNPFAASRKRQVESGLEP